MCFIKFSFKWKFYCCIIEVFNGLATFSNGLTVASGTTKVLGPQCYVQTSGLTSQICLSNAPFGHPTIYIYRP